MSKYEPIYLPEVPVRFGLSASEWDVSIDKIKSPYGRRVVVFVRHRISGRELSETVVGRFSKRDLNDHASRIVNTLVKILTN